MLCTDSPLYRCRSWPPLTTRPCPAGAAPPPPPPSRATSRSCDKAKTISTTSLLQSWFWPIPSSETAAKYVHRKYTGYWYHGEILVQSRQYFCHRDILDKLGKILRPIISRQILTLSLMNNIVSSQICSFSRCLPVVANVHELDEGRLRLPGHPILCRRHRLHLDYDSGFGKLYFMYVNGENTSESLRGATVTQY